MRSAYRRLGRVVDVAIPWAVGLFLVLVAFDQSERLSAPLVILGIAIGVAQGAAHRVALSELGMASRSLEDVFLELTEDHR